MTCRHLLCVDHENLMCLHLLCDIVLKCTCFVAITIIIGEHDLGRLNSSYTLSTAGRLEIYLDGHWGTICSIGFGAEEATLACNQLGYRTFFFSIKCLCDYMHRYMCQ